MLQGSIIVGWSARQSIFGIRSGRCFVDIGNRLDSKAMAKGSGQKRRFSSSLPRGFQNQYNSVIRANGMDQGTPKMMNFFKRKKPQSDITVEERRVENLRALDRLLKELAVSGDISMKKWQDEIKVLKNG